MVLAWTERERGPVCSYLGSTSGRDCDASLTLDNHVTTTRCRHGNRNRGWQEGRDDGQWEESWAIVTVDGWAAVIGSRSVEEASRTDDVPPLPRHPSVLPLEAVVVT